MTQNDERGPGGRPEVGPLITMRMPAKLTGWLDAHAKRTGTTRSHLIRRAIEQFRDDPRTAIVDSLDGRIEVGQSPYSADHEDLGHQIVTTVDHGLHCTVCDRTVYSPPLAGE